MNRRLAAIVLLTPLLSAVKLDAQARADSAAGGGIYRDTIYRGSVGSDSVGHDSVGSDPMMRGLVYGDSARTAMLRRAIEEEPRAGSVLDLLLPAMVRTGYRTRAWVRESLPAAGDSISDLDRLDMIYLRALRESEGDIESALFASLIACFEHKTIPFSFGLDLPLTFEPMELFNRRIDRLPRRLFLDRPDGDDRDKAQHFFASAWLAYALDNDLLADAIGHGVESGEALFIAGGADDPRDIRANRLGQLYVELLTHHPRALPSTMFRAWNRRYAQLQR